MKQTVFEIIKNEQIARDVFRMDLAGDNSAVTSPGQFVNIQLEGRFLRRPISVCDKTKDGVVIVYKTVGGGTRQLSGMKPGAVLDILTGLGNGYDLTLSGPRPLLIGGGAGVPPMFWLCRQLLAEGKQVSVILGFNTRQEVFFEEDFRRLGADVQIMTADGSYGGRGFVTDAMARMQGQYSYFYTCGPEPMFRAIHKIAETGGQFSFEERMGCGFGACMGCSCRTVTGYKRICTDGPVLEREEILW